MTHICINKLTIIGSDNGCVPSRGQAIIGTNARILLIPTFSTNCSEILSKINIFSFKKTHLKVSSAKWRPICLSLNVLKYGHVCYHKYISDLPWIGWTQRNKALWIFKIQFIFLKEMHTILFTKCQSFCLGPNVWHRGPCLNKKAVFPGMDTHYKDGHETILSL